MHSYRTWFSSTTNANRDTFPPEMYQYINISTEIHIHESETNIYIQEHRLEVYLSRARDEESGDDREVPPPTESRRERRSSGVVGALFKGDEPNHHPSPHLQGRITYHPTRHKPDPLSLSPLHHAPPPPPLTSTAPPHDVLGTIPPVHENLPHQRILQYFLLQSLGQGQGGENYACGCGARPRPALSRLVVKPRAPEQPQGA